MLTLKIKEMDHRILFIMAFMVGRIGFSQNTITEAEYFFDTDPGVGNANALTVTEALSIDQTFSIPVNSLAQGIHLLHVRTKNNAGQWGPYARQTFYIANFSSNLTNTITEIEYFFNTDPGVGNAEPLTVPTGNLVDTTLSIPLDGLSTGVHILHVRVKNNSNQWSIYARQAFFKSSQILNKTIVAAEFFVDEDPGVGNGIPFTITEGGTIDETVTLEMPSNLSAGEHFVHLRVLGSNGNWSLYGRPAEISTLSNNEFILDALRIYPNPASDVLHISMKNGLRTNQIKIMDITGKVVLETTKNVKQLDMSPYPLGLYVLQIKTEKGSLSKKIIKQ